MKLKLIHGDCLEEMKKLPDRSVDLFLCDLPYGCLTQQKGATPFGRNTKGPSNSGCAWDIKIDLEAFWIQVERLMKDDHTPIIHFCNTKFGYDLIKSKEKWFRYDLVWNKGNGVGFLSANKMPMRSHELIYVFAKKGARYNRIDIEGDFPAWVGSHSSSKVYKLPKPELEGYKKVDNGKRCALSVIQIAKKTNKGKHPTQKPDDLYKWLIERYSNKGDMILDATAGSFASCFTAIACGRQAIGIEKDEKFYNKALTISQL